MTLHTSSPRHLRACLLLSLSCIALLSGCDWLGIKNPFGDDRKGQQVVGPRRPPLLNPTAAPMQAPVSAVPPAAPIPAAAPGDISAPPPRPQASVDNDPYDYYDNAGHAASKASPAPAVTAPVAAPPAPLVRPAGFSDASVRKPLPGNAYASVPAQAEPEDDAQADGEPAAAEESSSGAAVPHGVLSWFKQQLGMEKPSAAADATDANTPYPSLSSVPPTPQQFDTIKINQAGQLHELQQDRAAAQQDKQALDSEPSSQKSSQPAAASAGNASQDNPPVLLGHVSAPDTLSPAADKTPAPMDHALDDQSLRNASAPDATAQPAVTPLLSQPAAPQPADAGQ
ncbi:MAG: hypothetical protein KGJ06_00495 [Pseudomonadota bacterium]|nr:hypothetical protein [Pseudomonadota bacterium]